MPVTQLGIQDVGLEPGKMKELCGLMKAAGKTTYPGGGDLLRGRVLEARSWLWSAALTVAGNSSTTTR